MGVQFDHLLTSPLVRARQTAEVIAEFVECESAIQEVSALGDEYSPGALLGALESYRSAARVGCVGHEPNLSEFATACLAPNGRSIIELPPSGIVGLVFDGRIAFQSARLRYLLRPEQLTVLTEQDAAAS
jgi:phosphohistidine phosphatase